MLNIAEGWCIGVDEDNPDGGIRIVDAQEVTVATAWYQPDDPKEWAENASRLIALAPELYGMVKQIADGKKVTASKARTLLVALERSVGSA